MPFLGAAGLGGLSAFLKPASIPTVFGGVLSEDSTYFYRTFFGNGTLTVSNGVLNADVLVVSGGGGGSLSGNIGSGGGGGSLLYASNQLLSPSPSYVVTVGAGGAQSSGAIGAGDAGGESSFASLSISSANGAAGGTNGSPGNGGPSSSSINGTVTNYTGGTGQASQSGSRRGGSGASPAGNGSSSYPAVGANGVATYSSWASATGTGDSGYYAGGGGGGYEVNGSASRTSGGLGGGGMGGAGTSAPNYDATSGTTNTGGGGGGCGGYTGVVGGQSGNGGSGVVIVRYLKTAVLPSTSSFEPIGTITLTSSQSSVVFSGLPSSQYRHLQLRAVARTDGNNQAEDIYLRFNGDSTASNYYYHGVYSTGTGAGAENNGSLTGARVMQCVGATGTAGSYGVGFVDILEFSSTTKKKAIRSLNGHADGTPRLWQSSNLWNSQSAITSITIVTNSGSNFVAGSRFSLYGLRGN